MKKTKALKGESLALKDWHIVHNQHDIQIKLGDDCCTVPEVFWPNLVTEGVLESLPKKGE